jgi:hypothetical protein
MDHPYSISDFAFAFRRSEGTTRDLIERSTEPSRGNGSQSRPDPDRTSNSSGPGRGPDRERTIYHGRNREYALRASEVRTLIELGKFRVVPADDLARFSYSGEHSRMEHDIKNLTRHGLAEQKTIEGRSYSRKVLTLTKDGHRLLEGSPRRPRLRAEERPLPSPFPHTAR